MGQFIDLHAADGQKIPAYVAEPAGQPRGGVVVLQEIFGVNSHIRDVADGYARDGYLAVAPSTFHRIKPGVELGYAEADMGEGFRLKQAVEHLRAPGVMQDIQAAIDHAAQASGGKVGIVGYCWGGLLTWRAACTLNGLSAAAPYYGGGMTQPDEIGGLETQSSYVVVNDADEVYARAQIAGAEIVVKIRDEDYGGRGFICRDLEGRLWSFGTYNPWQ